MITDKKAHLIFLEDTLTRHEEEYNIWKSDGYPQPLLDLFQEDMDKLKTIIENVKKEIS